MKVNAPTMATSEEQEPSASNHDAAVNVRASCGWQPIVIDDLWPETNATKSTETGLNTGSRQKQHFVFAVGCLASLEGLGHDAFVSVGFCNWKNAVARERGFHKHQSLKDHFSCYTMWKEQERCVSTLVNAGQLKKNRYYVSSFICVVWLLTENQLPLRRKIETFDNMLDFSSPYWTIRLKRTVNWLLLWKQSLKTPYTPVRTCKMNS